MPEPQADNARDPSRAQREDWRGLRLLAEQAARAGGQVAREGFERPYKLWRKADGTVVTEVDEAAQQAVLACLRAARGHDAVIAEEQLAGQPPDLPAGNGGRLCWVIDPLDGTRNYVAGVPIYTCSVAVMADGAPIAGAIHDPERAELYSASRGEGLFRNGGPVPAGSAAARWARAGLRKPLAGIPSALTGTAYRVVQSWRRRVIVRNLGVTSLHLALVALGRLQACLVADSKLWDIAAGWLMIELAGGVMTTFDDEPLFPRDVSAYAGEAIPSLASCDRQVHERLLPGPGGP
jgi:myo-inositol-1(or 4)-monophosphatase